MPFACLSVCLHVCLFVPGDPQTQITCSLPPPSHGWAVAIGDRGQGPVFRTFQSDRIRANPLHLPTGRISDVPTDIALFLPCYIPLYHAMRPLQQQDRRGTSVCLAPWCLTGPEHDILCAWYVSSWQGTPLGCVQALCAEPWSVGGVPWAL